MADKKKYWLKCSQTVNYYQEVELSKEEYSLLDSIDMAAINTKEYDIIERIIDPTDVIDTDGKFKNIQIVEE